MNSIARLSKIALPAFFGFGIAWLGVRLVSNEKKLQARKIELKIQLEKKV